MELALMAVSAVLFLMVVIYVQRKIPQFTKPGGRVLMTRLFLFLVALAFGWLVSVNLQDGLAQTLAFLSGFGLVHVPAAIILFIKSRRGAGRS